MKLLPVLAVLAGAYVLTRSGDTGLGAIPSHMLADSVKAHPKYNEYLSLSQQAGSLTIKGDVKAKLRAQADALYQTMVQDVNAAWDKNQAKTPAVPEFVESYRGWSITKVMNGSTPNYRGSNPAGVVRFVSESLDAVRASINDDISRTGQLIRPVVPGGGGTIPPMPNEIAVQPPGTPSVQHILNILVPDALAPQQVQQPQGTQQAMAPAASGTAPTYSQLVQPEAAPSNLPVIMGVVAVAGLALWKLMAAKAAAH